MPYQHPNCCVVIRKKYPTNIPMLRREWSISHNRGCGFGFQWQWLRFYLCGYFQNIILIWLKLCTVHIRLMTKDIGSVGNYILRFGFLLRDTSYLYRKNQISTEVTRDYRIHFKTRISPSKNTIKSLYQKFADVGNVNDTPVSGRKRSIRTENVFERIAVSIIVNLKPSTRKRTSQLTISQPTLCRILKKDLKLKPYKFPLTVFA